MMNKRKNKTIIIHSKIAYGYVGSNTTSLVLQMNGIDTITIPTILYSNHLGLPTIGGGIISDSLFADILDGVLKLNIFDEVSSIITDYIGSTEQIRITAEFIKKIQSLNPEISYLCDPVMGDTNVGTYVPQDVPQAIIKHLVPLADLLTPNVFELEYIYGKSFSSTKEILSFFEREKSISQPKIVVTGCVFKETPRDRIDIIIIEPNQNKVIEASRISVNPPGTGELFTAHLHLRNL